MLTCDEKGIVREVPDEAPLVAGGQGRSPEEVRWCGLIAAACFLALVVLAGLALIWRALS